LLLRGVNQRQLDRQQRTSSKDRDNT